MDVFGRNYVNWNKSEKDITAWYQLYVESRKYKELVNKKKKAHGYREQTSGYHWGRDAGRGSMG